MVYMYSKLSTSFFFLITRSFFTLLDLGIFYRALINPKLRIIYSICMYVNVPFYFTVTFQPPFSFKPNFYVTQTGMLCPYICEINEKVFSD